MHVKNRRNDLLQSFQTVETECISKNKIKEANERRAASSAKKEFAKELQNLINNHKGNLSKATVLNYIEQIEDVGIGIYS